jgi:membrane protein required for colicin V production
VDSIPIHFVDVIAIAVLVVSGFFAFARGFVHEVLSVIGWIGAIFAAIYGVPYLRAYARQFIESDLIADVAAGGVIFLVTLLVLSLITHAISRRIKESSLNAVDRSLGFVYGLARGAVLVVLTFILLEWLLVPPPPTEEQKAAAETEEKAGKPPPDPLAWMRGARTLPLMQSGAQLLASVVPGGDTADAAARAHERRREAQELFETQEMFRDLLTPEPKKDTSTDEGGYSAKERKGMERLIETNR